MLKPTRYEAILDFDPSPQFKSTEKVIVAMGTVGRTEPTPGKPADETTPAVAAVPATDIWGVELGIPGNQFVISIRRATNDPNEIKHLMSSALRKIADALDKTSV